MTERKRKGSENNDLEDIQVSKAEKRLLLLLSKNEFTVKELSFVLTKATSTIRSQLQSLREKGLIWERNKLYPDWNKYYTKLTPKIQSLLEEETY